jgi:ferric-dicitrate binding protein FerR (iron transport regulator)
MNNKSWSRKLVAISVAAAVLSVYSMLTLATPGARSGELSVIGSVTVNGQMATSGGTIFSDSVIVTAKDSSATVSLGKLGRIELLANTSIKLSFTDNSIMGLLDSGRARVSTPVGVLVNLTTKDGSVVVNGSQATSFSVNTENGNTLVTTESGLAELRSGTTVKQIAAGENAGAGTPQGGTKKDNDDNKLSGGALAALLLAAGGAVAAIIWASTHKNDLNFGGTVNVVSPTK